MNDPRDDLDRALDDALESYCEATATDGLEQRVLARVAADGSVRLKRLLVWAAAAVLLVATATLTWRVSQQVPVQMSLPSKTAVAETEVKSAPVRVAALQPAARVRRVRITQARQRLARFPTPSPLTSEERALMQLAAAPPDSIPVELTHFGEPIKPLEIAAVVIKPLELRGDTKE